jgi:hypothetical protein
MRGDAMVYRGHVQGGSVVIDDACLPEGTQVEIRIVPESVGGEPSAVRPWLQFAGSIDNLPSEASGQIDQTLYGSTRE